MNTVQPEIEIIIEVFSQDLQLILGEKLHAAYVFGAAAFNDNVPTGDIDFHVILTEALTPREKEQLEQMHEELARRFPPLGSELDGYYILLTDALGTTPPRSQLWSLAIDEAWALHREHIRAGWYIHLFGSDPKTIYAPADWSELDRALQEELRYVRDHLFQYPDYCILNLCRLQYSYRTRDVVISKAKASEWGLSNFPEWSTYIKLARKSYQGLASADDRIKMKTGVQDFFNEVDQEINFIRQS